MSNYRRELEHYHEHTETRNPTEYERWLQALEGIKKHFDALRNENRDEYFMTQLMSIGQVAITPRSLIKSFHNPSATNVCTITLGFGSTPLVQLQLAAMAVQNCDLFFVDQLVVQAITNGPIVMSGRILR